VINGDVADCAGLAAPPPRPATVRIMQGRATVVSTRVIAGDPTHQHYRVTVAPGRYRVETTNWPGVQRNVTVRAGSHTTVDFPNVCD
jgi:ferric-dicitrate binding protein FerR (iron transport regulator)